MKGEKPEVFYKTRKEQLKNKLAATNDRRRRIAWQRFLIVLATGFTVYQTWNFASAFFICLEIVAGFSLFLLAVSKDEDAKNTAINLAHLIAVIDKEMRLLRYEYSSLETGIEFEPPHHAYASDLDIFGEASVYQYINRCTSEQGKALLAKLLLSPLSKQQVEEEQEAVSELTNKPLFIHQLQAYGNENHITKDTERKIGAWLHLPFVYAHKKWCLLAFIFPFFSISIIFLYLFNIVSSSTFYVLLFVCYLISILISKNINTTYDILYKVSTEIATLHKQLEWIASESFISKKMVMLKQMLSHNDTTVSHEIRKFYAILNRFDIRLNHFAFFFLNTLFFWDLHQLLALNRWKNRNEAHVAAWFTVIAETEYSCSLATLLFNKPDWAMPVISDGFFNIEAKNTGHPLLNENVCVANSFSMSGQGKVAIITGSNMGGKSTFLRSLGVNIVLAFMGAPVCAASFSVSHIHLVSSMRVADNLSESTSTFYAELKKLKTIIEAVNNHEPVFILLDEILRGTNSLDRHAGSVALLKQFIQRDAVAVIATHDVELAKLASDYPDAVQNYHFDVQAKGAELYFDYKLKTGICRSMNASILMKSIGIEMQ